MKFFFCTLFLSVVALTEIYTQNSVIDSLINAQSDSVLRGKMIAFKNTGIEKPLNVGFISADTLIGSAKKYLGMPHCMGGNGKTSKKQNGRKCIDCSGLLYATFNDLGLKVDIHSAQELARFGKIITDTAQIQKGDLLFFVRSYGTTKQGIFITHAAISLGNHQMIHTSASKGVEITRTDSEYWGSRFIFATRIFY